jgi:hypothetical protein
MSFGKNEPYRNKKITQSAKGEVCQMRIPGICMGGTETTVWAHSNAYTDGKGIGQKAHDCFGAYMCAACHDEFDGRTRKSGINSTTMEFMFTQAMKRSWLRLLKKGVLK